MKFKIINFIFILKNIEKPSFFRKRNWDDIYYNKTVSFWNYLIWIELLKYLKINNSCLNYQNFNSLLKFYISDNEINKLYNYINVKSKCINLDEFDIFLECISEEEYLKLLNCFDNDSKDNLLIDSDEKIIDYDTEIFLSDDISHNLFNNNDISFNNNDISFNNDNESCSDSNSSFSDFETINYDIIDVSINNNKKKKFINKIYIYLKNLFKKFI